MAYGKYSVPPRFEIDFTRYSPISVITNYTANGNLRPEIIQNVNPDESRERLKIQGIKYHKDIQGGILLCCLVNHYGYQKQINLVFYLEQHVWVIEK